jgi:hypothetical protein
MPSFGSTPGISKGNTLTCEAGKGTAEFGFNPVKKYFRKSLHQPDSMTVRPADFLTCREVLM